jgi:hypothetical protein
MKIKAFPFIAIGTVLHLGLCVTAFSARMNCNFHEQCMSAFARVSEQVLALPLYLFVLLFHVNGGGPGGLTLFYAVLNSILAVTILWLVLVRPFVRHAAKKNSA